MSRAGIAAIVAPDLDVDRLEAEVLAEMADLARAEAAVVTAESEAGSRRVDVGRVLIRARRAWPERGPRAKGWGQFLMRVGISQPTAWRYMELAGFMGERDSILQDGHENEIPTYAEIGMDNRSAPTDDRPHAADGPEQAEEPSRIVGDGELQSTTLEIDIDRDTWCTPRAWAEALGRWDLDPCTNDRSHIVADETFDLGRRGQNGLALASAVSPDVRVFCNPPYSAVGPWVDAYGRTRFCFLLKFDPSTKWFARLMAVTGEVLIPRGTRVEFEAPPDVPKEKRGANPFPHAFFFARGEDVPDALRAMCFPGWRIEKGSLS